ncbi:MAG: hypothetical protein KGV57_01345 [Fusobacterium sp.]|nr:hypothetical protein [Fusobacterium sp.]
MEVLEKKRKNIDLDIQTMKTLGLFATKEGKSLKGYIEDSLREKAEILRDSSDYTFLLNTKPEGRIIISSEEQREFEKYIGI